MFGSKNVGIQLPIAKIPSMEEILHHLGCIKLWKLWDKLLINCFDLFHQQNHGKGYEIATYTLHGLLTSDCAWSTAPFLKKCCTLVVSFPQKKKSCCSWWQKVCFRWLCFNQSMIQFIHRIEWQTNPTPFFCIQHTTLPHPSSKSRTLLFGSPAAHHHVLAGPWWFQQYGDFVKWGYRK